MQLNKKIEDAENNNSELDSLKTQISSLAQSCKQTYKEYTSQRDKVLTLRSTGGTQSSWNSNDSWGEAPQTSWPVNSSVSPMEMDNNVNAGLSRYRALYEFVARNGDEVSFQPGDIILVSCNTNVTMVLISLDIRYFMLDCSLMQGFQNERNFFLSRHPC